MLCSRSDIDERRRRRITRSDSYSPAQSYGRSDSQKTKNAAGGMPALANQSGDGFLRGSRHQVIPISIPVHPPNKQHMQTVINELNGPSGVDLVGRQNAEVTSFEYAESHDRRILIVDDEEPVRSLFAAILNQDYSCETAPDSLTALDFLAREPFALVITDVQMPGLSGIELLRKIVERYPETAVIVVSGVDRAQRVIDAIRMGAADYLTKPCDVDVLTISVQRALERRILLRNAGRYEQALEKRNAELARQKAEMAQLHAQVIHVEKMASLGQLAAGVAHELNNPAGFICSNLELLTEHVEQIKTWFAERTALLPLDAGGQGSASYQSFLSELDSILSDCYLGAERIRDVVQNLRLFSRLDEAELKRVDLNEGIESTVRLLSGYFKSGGIRLVREYGELPLVNCYAAQLNQVWMNVLVNAAQAIGDKAGEVRVKTLCEGSKVTVSISDNGPGIPPERITKIFDPFFTTKPVGEGTGLGLSISHGIIERHGGRIDVESAAGRGTSFIISIPIDAGREANSTLN